MNDFHSTTYKQVVKCALSLTYDELKLSYNYCLQERYTWLVCKYFFLPLFILFNSLDLENCL